MTEENWHAPFAKTFELFLDGAKLEWLSADGNVVTDDSFSLIFNAHHQAVRFKLPEGAWTLLILGATEALSAESGFLPVEGRSLSLFVKA